MQISSPCKNSFPLLILKSPLVKGGLAKELRIVLPFGKGGIGGFRFLGQERRHPRRSAADDIGVNRPDDGIKIRAEDSLVGEAVCHRQGQDQIGSGQE
jgi:hypothetical protein